MTRETRRLLARRLLGYATLGEFVDWAVLMLEAGADTEHLRMLASLGPPLYRDEVAFYFEQTMSELGWAVPEPEHLTRRYAQDLAQDIVDGAIDPIEGCHQMYRLYCDCEAPGEMQAWLSLDDQWDEETYQDLEGAAWEAAIKREAQKFLEMKP